MSAIFSCTHLNYLPAVGSWLPHSDAAKAINASRSHEPDSARLDSLVHGNVRAQLADLRTHPSVALGLANKTVTLHGWVFEIEAETMLAFDGITRKIVSLFASCLMRR